MNIDLTSPKSVIEALVPKPIQRFVEDSGTKIVELQPGQKFRDVIAGLRSAIKERGQLDPDNPFLDNKVGGMYDPFDNQVVLKIKAPVPIIHEYGHALDAALARVQKRPVPHDFFDPNPPFKYLPFWTYENPKIDFMMEGVARGLWKPITDYMMSSVSDFFAECFAAYCNAGDYELPTSEWKENYRHANRSDLEKRLYPMYTLMEALAKDPSRLTATA